MRTYVVALLLVGCVASVAGQGRKPGPSAGKPPAVKTVPKPAPVAPAPLPPGYVIGPDDVLAVVFWREQDMSAEVFVRPDGKITLPLLNDVQAAGLTPEELRGVLTTAAAKFVEEPNVTIVVKAINSRRVFITGQVARPGPYPLSSSMTVVQLIAVAGGLTEYADSKNIVVMRTGPNGAPTAYKVNYKDLTNRKNLKQNIDLKPGDTVVVR